MLDLIQAPLEHFPDGVLFVENGAVAFANHMARHFLPGLQEGAPCPEDIPLPSEGAKGAGVFTAGETAFTYSCAGWSGGRLLTFRPAPQTALTGPQLDGVLVQLRGLLGDVLAEVGPATAPDGPPVASAAFGRSFHRLFRLMGNLEYMREASGEEGVLFRPVTMDLEGLCRHVVRQAGPLLRQAGVSLDYESALTGLLIPGDPELLQRLLLELLANAARAADGGGAVLSLRRQGDRALLAVSHNGPLPSERQVAALFQQGEAAPLPGQGAGLGMSIARDIASLHKGSFLVEWGQSAPSVLVSLPTGPLSGQISVRTPVLQRDGGLDPVLTQLSDLLPDQVFGLEGLD